MPYYFDYAEMGLSSFGVRPCTMEADWSAVVCLAEASFLCGGGAGEGGILGAEKKGRRLDEEILFCAT